MTRYIIKHRIYILGLALLAFSCSNNNNQTVIFHFSKEEIKELNKTGKVVQTDDKGIERVFIYDDKFDKVAKKTNSDPKKVKEKQEAVKKRLAEKKAAELENVILSVNETKIEILKKIQERLMKLDFRVEIDEKTGVIRLPQKEMFATAEHELSSDGIENINKL